MPKGIRASKAAKNQSSDEVGALERLNSLIVPVGATHYPSLVEGDRAEELPVGIKVRSGRSIQVEYSLGGKRRAVKLPRVPTVGAVRAAGAFRQRLADAVDGKASEDLILLMVEHEVASCAAAGSGSGAATKAVSSGQGGQPVRAAAAVSADEQTCGQVLDEYLCVRWTALSPNSRRDYVGYIRSRFKPMLLSEFGLPPSSFVAGQHSGMQPPDAAFTADQSAQVSADDWRPSCTIPSVREYVDVPLEPGEQAAGRWKRRRAEWKRLGGESSGPSPESMKKVLLAREVELPLQCFAQLRVAALDDVVAAKMVATWLNTLSRKSVINLLGFLKPAFERLVAKGKLPQNPFRAVEVSKADSGPARAGRPDMGTAEVNYLARTEDEAKAAALYERDESEPDPLTDDEMIAVLEQCDSHMRDHYSFAFMAGTRTGEQLALRARDYDRHNSRIRVRRSQSRGIEGRTKTFTERWVNLNSVAQAVVERQLARCRTPDDYLFVNPFTGRPWSGPNKVTKRWTRALQAAGVRYRRPYHTRHTYATLMLLAGESPYYVAAQLGHTDLEMLEKRYARFIEAGRARKPGAAMAQVHAATLQEVAVLLGVAEAPKA